MPTIQSILCPVDFSEHSRTALAWAAAIAARRRADLSVLTVVDPLLAHAATARIGASAMQSDYESALRDFIAETLPTASRQELRIRIAVQVGAAAETILRSSREGSNLVVMGTQGLGGVRKLMLGSTTERVLRRTRVPVLAVHIHVAAGRDASPAATVHVGRILMATDFGAGASAALPWAIEFARDFAVPILFAHVVIPVSVPRQWQASAADVDQQNAAAAVLSLEQFSAGVTEVSSTRQVVIGRPDEAIASLAAEHGAGLIVMGLANEHDAAGTVPGTIAYRVLRAAEGAVLVVPPSA